jgi:hypothetical protein
VITRRKLLYNDIIREELGVINVDDIENYRKFERMDNFKLAKKAYCYIPEGSRRVGRHMERRCYQSWALS